MSEKQFKALVQEAADLTAILDVNGLCKYATPNYPKLVGYNQDEVIGMSAFDFIHYADVERIRCDLKRLITEKRVKTEPYRFRCKDGTWCWMQSTCTNMLHVEDVEGFVINTVDITDIINVRNTHKESNERYELINKATKDAIYDWDVVNDEFTWGQNLQRIFGHKKADKVFRLSDWFNLVHEEDRVQIQREFKKFIEDEQRAQWTKTFRFKKGDGSFAYVEETGQLMRDVIGKPIRMVGVIRDVTQSKELQTLLDNATSLARVGAWEFDVITQQVYWSAMTKMIHEVDEHFVPNLEEGITFYKAGDSRNTILKKTNEAIEKGISWDEELQIVTAKGNELWVRVIGNTEMINGQCVRIYGSFQDIDKQKTAELKLQTALKEKNTILESIGDAFFAVDRNWMVTYWNKQAKNLLGLQREQIVGKNFWSVFEDAVGLEFYTQYHIAMSTGNNVQFEEYYPVKNSWYEVSAYASDNGLSVYFRDITSRKLADEEIYRSNERYVKVTEATNDVIWDWDIVNDRLNYSGSFKKLFGYQPDTSIPLPQWWSRYIYPEDIDAVFASLHQCINDKKASVWQMEYRFVKIDGVIAHVMDRGVIIRDKDGNGIRMVGAMADITGQKQYEQLLKSLNHTLDAKAKELATYITAIEAQNERLRKIAWTQSHLVREPLTRIMGIAKLLVDHTMDHEQKDQMLKYVQKSADELDKIIREIVESSHQQNLNED